MLEKIEIYKDKAFEHLTIKRVFILAFLLRIIMLIYSEWQDYHCIACIYSYAVVVKFTDIDYAVYTDAARHIYNSESPYDRATYRYTPLIAYLCIPNIFFHQFAKLVFIALDVVSGVILMKILEKSRISSSLIPRCLAYWLLNPITITISVRGSSDIITIVLVYSAIYFLIKYQYVYSGLFLGLSIHIRLYPVIYTPIFLFTIYNQYNDKNKNKNKLGVIKDWFKFCFTVGVVVISLIGIFYLFYGYSFLYETYLYHYIRKDNRHNFSFLFYSIYLLYSNKLSTIISLLSFLPTIMLILIYTVRFRNNLFICMFLQTITFVIFNKVITAQYYVWYLSLIPFIIDYVNISFFRGIVLCLLWLFTELHWLLWGYFLEMKGINTFIGIWIGSGIFFITHVYIIMSIIKFSSINQNKKHLKNN